MISKMNLKSYPVFFEALEGALEPGLLLPMVQYLGRRRETFSMARGGTR